VRFTFDEYLKIISAGALRDHEPTTLIDGVIHETNTAVPLTFWQRVRQRWVARRPWFTPGLTLIALMLAAWAFVFYVILAPSSAPLAAPAITPGSVDGGWTQVGNGTRLQFLDLADGVRCYRMRFSSEMSCVRLTAGEQP
jgi:hypothetical protein